MNKILTKVTALCVGLAMVAGVGVAVEHKSVGEAGAIDSGYDISETPLKSLSGGEKVAFGPSTSVLAKNTADSNWLRCGTFSEASIYEVEKDGTDFYLKTGSNYVYSSAAKKIALDSSNKTAITLGSDGEVECSLGVYAYNANSGNGGIRCYASLGTLTSTYLYEVSESSKTLTSIEVTGSMTKTAYTTAESWDPSGLVVTAHYDDSSSATVTSSAEWTYSPAAPADGVTSVVATASYGGKTASSSAQAVTVEVVVAPIVLNSSNWPVTATSTHTNVQQSTLDGIVYENVGGYKYSNQLSLNYAVDNYFGNRTAFSRNIKSIVVVYSTNVTSYVKMYEGSEPCTKTTLVTSSGTTSVTYTFSDTNPYFRLNMDTSTPKGTFCNITSMTITLGSAADKVDLEGISLNGNASNPVGVEFRSALTLSPANANNKDTIAWNSSNTAVATVDANGVVTCLSAGSTTITATATDLVNVSASYSLTVFTATPIEKIYYMSSGASLDFNGVYVGFATGTGPIIMNGAYGIVVYDSSLNVSEWTENETIVNIKGTLDIYSGLYEVKSPSYMVLEAASDVTTPQTYTVVGGESQLYESRKTYVPGTVVSVSGSWTSDTTVIMNVGGTQITCFAKANAIDSETGAKIIADAEVTLTGFTGWHNGFQVTITGVLEHSESYTAVEFAEDLLSQTDAVCVNYEDGVSSWQEFHDEFVSIWNDLNSADKYQSLSSEERAALVGASREGSEAINLAMYRYDFLTGKYQLDNFITGRSPIVPAGSYLPSYESNLNSSSSITIIVIVAVASMTLLGVTLVIRKRKMN